MEYSCFTSYGQLEYSSDLPDAEKIYESIRASYTDPKTGVAAVDMTPGTYHEAKIYARAMALADGAASVKRAGNQGDPLKATESIPVFEDALRLAPKPTATLDERRAAVATRRLASRGNRREALYDALATILGAALLAVRPIATDEATMWPADPVLGPGVFTRTEQPSKVIRLVDPVTTLHTPITITYANWDESRADIQLVKGDVLAFQPENLGLAEQVTILGVAGAGATRSLTAVFTKAHDEDSSATTGPSPIWASDTGHLFIVVTAAAAANAELCDRVNDLLTRRAKAGTTWSIVQPTTGGASTIGPFTLDSSPLGSVTVGSMNIVHADPPVLGPCVPALVPEAGGTSVTLYGRHFTSASDVKVDGVSVAFTVVSDFRIKLTTVAHANGGQSITVVTPFGTATRTFEVGFGLSVMSISPTRGPNTGGTKVRLRGQGFLAAIDVTVNGFSLVGGFTIIDDNNIDCVTDAVGGPSSLGFVVDDGVNTATSPAMNFL